MKNRSRMSKSDNTEKGKQETSKVERVPLTHRKPDDKEQSNKVVVDSQGNVKTEVTDTLKPPPKPNKSEK